MSIPVTFSLGNLAADFCWTTGQAYAEALIAILSGSVAGDLAFFNFGISTPAPADQGKPWLRLNADGTPDRWYVYVSGKWIWPHPIPASSAERKIYRGTLVALRSYDGGDGTSDAPTDTTGAMWERDTDFGDESGSNCFRSPIGAGTNPTAYDGGAARTISLDEKLGVERVALAAGEMPPHTHQISGLYENGISPAEYHSIEWNGDSNPLSTTDPKTKLTDSSGGSGGVVQSHYNLHPVIGVYFIKRTARRFYCV